MDRAKLRALAPLASTSAFNNVHHRGSYDDAYEGRRPSLPINIPSTGTPTSTSFRATSNAFSSIMGKPLPDVPPPSAGIGMGMGMNIPPSSDPGPTAAFDLDYIFGERMYPNGPLLPQQSQSPTDFSSTSGNDFYPGGGMGMMDSGVGGGPRRLSVSLDSGVSAVHAYAQHQHHQHQQQQRRNSSKATITGLGMEWEDTFSRFVSQGDREFHERRQQWSFMRAPPQSPLQPQALSSGRKENDYSPIGSTSTTSNSNSASAHSPPSTSTSTSPSSPSKIRSPKRERATSTSAKNITAVADGIEPTGVWECGALGRYWVGLGDEEQYSPLTASTSSRARSASRSRTLSGAGAGGVALGGEGSALGGLGGSQSLRRTSLVVRRFPSVNDGSEAPVSASSPPHQAQQQAHNQSSSAVRIHIHKHSRAPAHSLFLGASNPSAAARSSILLATKKVHLHLSAKKAAAAAAAASGTSTSKSGSSSKHGGEREREREGRDKDGIPQSPTSLSSPLDAHAPSFATAIFASSSSSGALPSPHDTTPSPPPAPVNVDISLPRRAPPLGYIPSFVNRDLLETTPSGRPSEAMDIDRNDDNRKADDDDDLDSTASSPINGFLSTGRNGTVSNHGHGHRTIASDFATISPEVRAMLYDQLRTTKKTFGGRLKRALLNTSNDNVAIAPLNSVHPYPGVGLGGALSAEQHPPSYLANVVGATATYQPPWLVMAPGFVKEENERRLKHLKTSFQAAGMFSPMRLNSSSSTTTSAAVMLESESDSSDNDDDFVHVGAEEKRSSSRLGGSSRKRRGEDSHSRAQSRSGGSATTTAVDPTSSTGSGYASNSGKTKAATGTTPSRKLGKESGYGHGVRSQSISLPSAISPRSHHDARATSGHVSSGGEGKNSSGKKEKAAKAVVLPYRNKVLETVAADTMCMAIPLWDFRGEEERRRLGTLHSPLPATTGPSSEITHGIASMSSAAQKAFRRRSKNGITPTPTPASAENERQWLLVTYVPFNDDIMRTPTTATMTPSTARSMGVSPGKDTLSRQRTITSPAAAPPSSSMSPLGSLFFPPRAAKKRPRQPSVIATTASPSNPAPPALSLSHTATTAASISPLSGSRMVAPLRSFRIVGRILSTDQLRHSGLRFPGADLVEAQSSPSLASPPKPRRKPSKEDDKEEEPFTAIIAVCHDARSGHIEYVPEGLDALGFCGNAPQHVKGAVTPYTFEREVGPLSDIGREVVEICWAGSLALID